MVSRVDCGRQGAGWGMAFLWKWLWCSWRHRKHRCYPTVWGPEQAKEMGIPYRPNYWHCWKCHHCNEDILKWVEDG